MNLKSLKETVFRANMDLPAHGLVLFTWGNASGIDRERRIVVIKPSGVSYDNMKPEDMVALDLDGKVLEGDLKPSSDAPTHLVLYRKFKEVGGIVHTHSRYATAWAQARRDIPAIGTTHADYFYGPVPCTRDMSETEIKTDYETETGNVIVECFKKRSINPVFVPGVLVSNHGPFTWGKSPGEAVHNAVVLEEIARMGLYSSILNPELPMNPFLIEKHFNRKHGPDAYYGQRMT